MQCVICGSNRRNLSISRYSIILKQFIKGISRSQQLVQYDDVRLCQNCSKRVYANNAILLKYLFKECGLDYSNYNLVISLLSVAINKCRLKASTAARHTSIIQNYCKLNNIEYSTDPTKIISKIKDPYLVIRDTIGLDELTFICRKHFMEINNPNVMPNIWKRNGFNLAYGLNIDLEKTDDLYLKIREAAYGKCFKDVVCGKSKKSKVCVSCNMFLNITKHHVVPQRFLNGINLHGTLSFYNIQYLCRFCHDKYEKISNKLTHELFYEAGIVEYREYLRAISFLGGTETSDMTKYSDYLVAKEVFDKLEIDLPSNSIDAYNTLRNTDVYALVRDCFPLKEFFLKWKTNFEEEFNPKYLPLNWAKEFEEVIHKLLEKENEHAEELQGASLTRN